MLRRCRPDELDRAATDVLAGRADLIEVVPTGAPERAGGSCDLHGVGPTS